MAEDAVSELREMIVFGEIPPGAPLRLESLARSLDMSVSPAREAVRQLENLGLAEHVPYKGARVTNIDAAEMRDVYEARFALETAAVRRVAMTFDETADALVSSALAQLEQAYVGGNPRLIVRGNTDFHAAIAAGTRSEWLERLIRPTLDASQRFAALLLQRREQTSIEIERLGHQEITAACRAGDPDKAEDALRRHLSVFEEQFARALDSGT